MDDTPNLSLPYVQAAQAQKHVTINESLAALDALVLLAVLDRDLAAPPGAPAEGARYIVAAGATGAWSGQEGAVAIWRDGAWAIYAPKPGWRAWLADEAALAVWTGSAWETAWAQPIQNAPLIGVNATADATNRLAVASAASLFNHAGAGHQVKLNKAAAADTASVLFQTAFSGRVEYGLTGDDDFHLKVSADGAAWNDALCVDKSTAFVGLGTTSPTARLTVQTDTGRAIEVDLEEGDGVFQATRYADSSNAPVFFGRKARGTRAAPTAVQAGDTLIGFRGYGHDGSAFVAGASGAAFLLEAAETWAAGTNYGTQIRLFTTANASTANLERLRIANDGALTIRGDAQVLVDADGLLGLRSYTVATLPSAAAAARLIYVADESGGAAVAFSDGTNWRRVTDRVVVS
jgi:hypothetical protein